jgi:hypothetical protein
MRERARDKHTKKNDLEQTNDNNDDAACGTGSETERETRIARACVRACVRGGHEVGERKGSKRHEAGRRRRRRNVSVRERVCSVRLCV